MRSNVILFDFDGTLVNTTPLILKSFRHVWTTLWGFCLADEDYVQTFGIPLELAMDGLITKSSLEAQRRGLDSYVVQRTDAVMCYREYNLLWHDQLIERFADIGAMLDTLSAEGYAMGIVSSKMRRGIERGMACVGLLPERFDVIVGADDVTRHKPDPEPLLVALSKLGAPVEKSIYVGDSIHDVAAGRAARMPTVAVGWGPFSRKMLEDAAPTHLISLPGELPGIARKCLGGND